MRGLNLVLSICMGPSFSEVAKGYVDIANGKLLCVDGGVKLFGIVNVGS